MFYVSAMVSENEYEVMDTKDWVGTVITYRDLLSLAKRFKIRGVNSDGSIEMNVPIKRAIHKARLSGQTEIVIANQFICELGQDSLMDKDRLNLAMVLYEKSDLHIPDFIVPDEHLSTRLDYSSLLTVVNNLTGDTVLPYPFSRFENDFVVHWNMGEVTSLDCLFAYCDSEEIILDLNLRTRGADLSRMFLGCHQLKWIKFCKGMHLENVSFCFSMFEDCSALSVLDLHEVDFSVKALREESESMFKAAGEYPENIEICVKDKETLKAFKFATVGMPFNIHIGEPLTHKFKL